LIENTEIAVEKGEILEKLILWHLRRFNFSNTFILVIFQQTLRLIYNLEGSES